METFQGLSSERASSRVLKPPGGGHSNIFGPDASKPIHTRPKYDQQNSSNISGALGTADANEIAEATAREVGAKQPSSETKAVGESKAQNGSASGDKPSAEAQQANSGRGRVPPGGFSQGFW